jgi:hypothetical protein
MIIGIAMRSFRRVAFTRYQLPVPSFQLGSGAQNICQLAAVKIRKAGVFAQRRGAPVVFPSRSSAAWTSKSFRLRYARTAVKSVVTN